MSDVSPINSYAHLSGEPPGSPEQGSPDPTTDTTALELPEPEGHNLLEEPSSLCFKLIGPTSWFVRSMLPSTVFTISPASRTGMLPCSCLTRCVLSSRSLLFFPFSASATCSGPGLIGC